jgi:hypothetical protein
MNTALMSAVKGLPLEQAIADTEHWGRLVETAVGAHLLARSSVGRGTVYYWRDGSREVDYVLESAAGVTAVEVKSGRRHEGDSRGMDAFLARYRPRASLLVGQGGMPLEAALAADVG